MCAKEKKKEIEFLKESIFASGDFSGLCVKMVRKYFIIVCKKIDTGLTICEANVTMIFVYGRFLRNRTNGKDEVKVPLEKD